MRINNNGMSEEKQQHKDGETRRSSTASEKELNHFMLDAFTHKLSGIILAIGGNKSKNLSFSHLFDFLPLLHKVAAWNNRIKTYKYINPCWKFIF